MDDKVVWNCSAGDGVIDELYVLTTDGVYIYVKAFAGRGVIQVYSTTEATSRGFTANYVGDTLFGSWEVWSTLYPDESPVPTNVIWRGYQVDSVERVQTALNLFKAGLGIRVN